MKRINWTLFLIIILINIDIVFADGLDIKEEAVPFTYVIQKIWLNENNIAHIKLRILIDNSSNSNNINFRLNDQRMSYKDFYCKGVAISDLIGRKTLFNNSTEFRYEDSITFWFNDTQYSKMEINCDYNISNYTSNVEIGEWSLYDGFQNKHNLKYFDLYIYTPKDMVFKEVGNFFHKQPSRKEDLEEEIYYRWSKDKENARADVYIKLEDKNLTLEEQFYKHYDEYLIAGFIGAIIALSIGKFLSIIISLFKFLFYKYINKTTKLRKEMVDINNEKVDKNKTEDGRKKEKYAVNVLLLFVSLFFIQQFLFYFLDFVFFQDYLTYIVISVIFILILSPIFPKITLGPVGIKREIEEKIKKIERGEDKNRSIINIIVQERDREDKNKRYPIIKESEEFWEKTGGGENE